MNFHHFLIVALVSTAIFTVNSHSDQVKNYCDGSDSLCENEFIASKNSLTLKMKLKYVNRQPAIEINLQDQNQFKVNDAVIDQNLMQKLDLASFFSIEELYVFFQNNFKQRVHLSSNGTISFEFPFLQNVKTRFIGTSQKISKGKIQQLLDAINHIKNDILGFKKSTQDELKNISSTTFYDIFIFFAVFALIFHSIWICTCGRQKIQQIDNSLAKLSKSCDNLSDPHKQYFKTQKTENSLKITITAKTQHWKNYILPNQLPVGTICTFKFKIGKYNDLIGISTRNAIGVNNIYYNKQYLGYFSGTGVVYSQGKEQTKQKYPAKQGSEITMVVDLINWTVQWNIEKDSLIKKISDGMKLQRLYVALGMMQIGNQVELMD